MIAPVITSAAAKPPAADLQKAAQKFEAVFLRQMIAAMRQGKLSKDLLGSSATDNFREMADANTADTMAKRGAFGIARLVEQQLGGKK